MEYWIWLTQIKGIGPVLQKKLLNHFKDIDSIYNADEKDLLLVDGIGSLLAKNIRDSKCLSKSNLILDEIHKKDIKILTINNPLYPSVAKEAGDSPILLYYKGNIREDIRGVSIVGSRRCTEYGKRITIEAASYLAQNDIPVISGMAKGIDGYAHTACIKNGGYTIAFLGNGLNICYPKEHIGLMEAIIENGAVISQYPPNIPPRPGHFPKRNTLISSWSEKMLVVEAAEASGALITADVAKKQGKQVLVPPHDIYSSTGRGTNKLLIEGASIYLNPAQLLLNDDSLIDENKITDSGKLNNLVTRKRKKIQENNLTAVEKNIIDTIADDIKTIEEISKDINIEEIKLLEYLSIMIITGAIETLPGGRYRTS